MNETRSRSYDCWRFCLVRQTHASHHQGRDASGTRCLSSYCFLNGIIADHAFFVSVKWFDACSFCFAEAWVPQCEKITELLGMIELAGWPHGLIMDGDNQISLQDVSLSRIRLRQDSCCSGSCIQHLKNPTLFLLSFRDMLDQRKP